MNRAGRRELLRTAAALSLAPLGASCQPAPKPEAEVSLALPPPKRAGTVSLEETLQKRRSLRQYKDEPVTLAEVGQLLWAAQGITHEAGRRTAPSAGALYPLEVYVAAGRVTDLAPGIYKYRTREHRLVRVQAGDLRAELAAAALGQQQIARGPATFVFSAVYERTAGRYKERTLRYVHMEAGHAAQNLCLQAVALGLGAVVMGAFEDERVKRAVGMPPEEAALYLVTVGRP
jgi:SagB-type dehydrogenase family enzyme